MHRLSRQYGEWVIKLISKVRSFRSDMILMIFLSVLFTVLTEGMIMGAVYLILSMTGQNITPVGIEKARKGKTEFPESLVYQGKRGMKDRRYFHAQEFPTFLIITFGTAFVIGIILFIVYFLLLTRKFSTYLKEIASGVQEVSLGNFENRIAVKNNSELSMIAENINVMANSIYLLLCDERQNEDVKNELITSVAHDLRTPLTSIIGYLYLVLYKENLSYDKKEHYIQIAYDKSKRLEELIEDLFRYTKYSSEEVKLHLEKIDFVRFMDQMVEEFYPSFKAAELNYEFSTDMPEAYIMADGNMLARAVGNLVSNAIKYGKDGKIIKISIKQEEQYLIMSVLNYGAIIPKEDLAHIFERFYRVENSRSKETGGSGLGLAIAKQIIEMHRGQIDVRSDYEGTIFEVKLKLGKEGRVDSHEVEEQDEA